jgi:hypothetical protein
MKKTNYIIIAVAAVCLATVSSCKKKQQTREECVEEFRAQLTHNDTTEMLQLADNAMELLKGKKIDEVIGSLYEYNDSTEEIKPLSKEMTKRLQRVFKMFPVQSYEREYFSFMLEGCNDVKYKVVFATAEQTGTDEPATTMFMFNPVRIDGEWKLCVKTPSDEVDEELL